ncbi:MAG: hypothetical protein ABWZ18_00835 [Solirubrobacterales bacterium]
MGTFECRAWETYYRREWAAFLVASVRMVHAAFRMSWPRTLRGAWLVLRANQRWAPVPDNDPAGARRLMTSFYRLLAAAEPDPAFEPMRAAELEVEWWRVHRAHQGGEEGSARWSARSPTSTRTATTPIPPRSAALPSCVPRRWTSPTPGSAPAVTGTIRGSLASAACSCAPTRLNDLISRVNGSR